MSYQYNFSNLVIFWTDHTGTVLRYFLFILLEGILVISCGMDILHIPYCLRYKSRRNTLTGISFSGSLMYACYAAAATACTVYVVQLCDVPVAYLCCAIIWCWDCSCMCHLFILLHSSTSHQRISVPHFIFYVCKSINSMTPPPLNP